MNARLGPYELISPLGKGGMGEVFRARDPRLSREVAIKILHTGAIRSEERLRRFQQEARAAGALNHPNVLAVFDVGEQDGAPYVVTELLEGETLRERIDRGPLPARKTLDLALQIARGLAGGKIDVGAARTDLLTVAQNARRLGARIDLAALRLPFHAAMQGHFERALRGSRDDAQAIAEVAEIGGRLGMHLDLWDLQNALWDAMRAGTSLLDREGLAPLAAALWIDEAALAGRAQRASSAAPREEALAASA